MLLAAGRHRQEKVSLSMKGFGRGRVSSMMALSYAQACTLIAISSSSPSFLNCSSANRLPCECFLCVLKCWRVLTLHNQPILKDKGRVNNSPEPSKLSHSLG
jgi:hypothetical protein